jgi:hypothetical protein
MPMTVQVVFQDVTEPDQGVAMSNFELLGAYPLIDKPQQRKNVSFRHDPAARSVLHERPPSAFGRDVEAQA